jgi:hypothetical protein
MNSFPFSDPDPKKLSQYADSIWKASNAIEVIKPVQSVSFNGQFASLSSLSQFNLEWAFEVLCFTLKYLEETYSLHLNELIFCDCLGLGLQVAVIASTFSFQELITIEISEEDVNTTLDQIRNCSLNLSPITIRIGRVQVLTCSHQPLD